MIPIKLKLYNFTSYGTNSPELDFSQFHMAAISGPNGAGKSSLIDSITWALWGESRAGSNSDKLIRQGQKEMRVEFDFELEGVNYTVKRRRSTKGAPLSALEFFSQGKNLSEATIKATQQKIINTLHMDYEIFVNSSYLRQGRADEFTLKPPIERKEILANILGLSGYDDLEEKAKEKAKELTTNIDGLNYQIIEIDNELQTKEEKTQDLGQIKKELQEIETREKEAERKLKEVQLKKEFATQRIAVLEKTKERVESLQKEIGSLENQFKTKEISVKDFQAILAKEKVINKNDQISQNLKEKLRGLQSRQTQQNLLQDQFNPLKNEESRKKEMVAALTAKLNESKNKGLELKKRLENLQSAVCPTCKQPIHNKEENVRLIEQASKILQEERSNYQKINSQLSQTESERKVISARLEEIEKNLKIIRKELALYQTLQRQIDDLAETQTQKIKLSEARERIEAETKALEDLKILFSERQKTYVKEVKELEEYQHYQEELVTVANNYKEQEEILSQIRSHLSVKRTEYGAAQKLVDRFQQLEEVKQKKHKEIELLFQDKVNYEELSLAFGKKGIQAILIETIIPEIETEANILLDKLTEGRMRVSLVTQREVKTGGTIETLDIIISDEAGSRSYETYSGGEAYRVNIAIRLALSRLLTHRAGARLQFLVIDEGFGTQDTQGRDRIVEAINLIQESFAKILIITHLEEFKEVFPARIEVTKNTEGSTFQVVT